MTVKKQKITEKDSKKESTKEQSQDVMPPFTIRNIKKLKWFEIASGLEVAVVEFEADQDDDDIVSLKRIILANRDFEPLFPRNTSHD
jgi:hypothetical protein